jgi:putative peptide zinc metalloprotease protein
MIGSVVFFSLLENGLPAISHTDLYWLPFLVGASMLVHELGHIAACRRFHVKHGAIGFGFYLIFPVVYADITQVWNSTRQQRIIANAGGIYAELIYATVLLMFYAVLREAIFSLAAVTVFVKAITELNPFFRYDGYWLLSDFTNTPNLMSRSNQALRKVISDVRTQGNIFSAIITGSIRSNAWLLGYALMNMILVTGYFAYVAIFFKSEIIHFPALLFFILKKAFFIQLTLADFPPGFLWVLGLYILVVKTCFQFAVQKLKSKTFVFNRVKKS